MNSSVCSYKHNCLHLWARGLSSPILNPHPSPITYKPRPPIPHPHPHPHQPEQRSEGNYCSALPFKTYSTYSEHRQDLITDHRFHPLTIKYWEALWLQVGHFKDEIHYLLYVVSIQGLACDVVSVYGYLAEYKWQTQTEAHTCPYRQHNQM